MDSENMEQASDSFQRRMTLNEEKEQLAKLNFDFPFDLNNLFSLQYSFDTLKQAIEFLAKQQAEMGK